jgi:hypothetical protein
VNTKRSCFLILSAACFAATLSYGLSATAKPKIADGNYFHAAPGDWGFTVKGNRYHWLEMGTDAPPTWRSTSELKQVKSGVILVGSKYFCSQSSWEKLPKKPKRITIAECTSSGWTKIQPR